MDFSPVFWDAGVACAGIGFFTAAWTFRQRIDGRVPDGLLALLLLLSALNTLHPFLTFHSTMTGPKLIEPLQFLLPVGLLWYLRSLRRERVFHAADSVMLLLAGGFILTSFAPQLLGAAPGWSMQTFSIVMWGTLALSSMAFLVPVTTQIGHFRKDLESAYSNLDGIDPQWLRGLLVALVLLFFVYALFGVLIVHAPPEVPLNRILGFFMGALTVHLSWMSLKRRPRLSWAPEKVSEALDRDGELAQRGQRIFRRMQATRLFLEPELTLDDLAKEVGLTRHETSAALNKGLGESFFDVVNGLRVGEFQRLCRDPTKRNDKILTLALEAGFNSKPSFNLIFKRTTGLTPSDYRRSSEIES